MTVAVLAVQGAFAEHEAMLQRLGVNAAELRKAEDLEKSFDGLVLPGGESTVQGKLLRELGMFGKLKERIAGGMPVLATCAGLILLAEELSNDTNRYFCTLPVTVKRNAYGRQLGSFFCQGEIEGIGSYPMEFIRAPYIESAAKEVSVLAKAGGRTVAVQYQNQLAMSFHPELTQDSRIHEKFLAML